MIGIYKITSPNKRIYIGQSINLETGIYYNSVKEVSEIYCINRPTLTSRLNGNLINNTQFIYA